MSCQSYDTVASRVPCRPPTCLFLLVGRHAPTSSTDLCTNNPMRRWGRPSHPQSWRSGGSLRLTGSKSSTSGLLFEDDALDGRRSVSGGGNIHHRGRHLPFLMRIVCMHGEAILLLASAGGQRDHSPPLTFLSVARFPFHLVHLGRFSRIKHATRAANQSSKRDK